MCSVNSPMRCCHFRMGQGINGGRQTVKLFRPGQRSTQAALCPLARTTCHVRLWNAEVCRGGWDMAPIDEGRSFCAGLDPVIQDKRPSLNLDWGI